MKTFAWSFSAMETFKTCPRKYYAEKVAKVVPFTKSSASEYGVMVHKKFEDRLVDGKKLPLDLIHHEKVMAKLANASGEGMGEQKLTINADYEPTDWFSKDAWLRGIIDYVKVNGKHAIIVDHKTGKQKDGFAQIDLMFALMNIFMPEIETATGMFYWTKGKKITSKTYIKADIPEIWNSFLPMVLTMQQAYDKDVWPCKPNGLCRRYCGYTDCQHHGV